MYNLKHHPLCPLSRQIRIALKEKDIQFGLTQDDLYWSKTGQAIGISDFSSLPVLYNEHGYITEASAIYEYLEEEHKERNLLGDYAMHRAFVRKIANCFNGSFFYAVLQPIIYERIVRFSIGKGEPDSSLIRKSKNKIYYFLDYIAELSKYNKWLASEHLTIADIVAASHLSVLDYFGDVPWEHNLQAKEWYSVIKSRPSFRPILQDRMPGFNPAPNYSILDF